MSFKIIHQTTQNTSQNITKQNKTKLYITIFLLIFLLMHPCTQIPVPQNRMTPLKTAWMQLYTPITDNLNLDMRMNLKTKKVEIKTTPQTTNPDVLQKAADFVHAYILGELSQMFMRVELEA